MKLLPIILLLALFYNGAALAGINEYKQASKAIKSDNLELLGSVIKSGININEIPTGQGMSLLGLAVYFNREKIVGLLIQSGASVIDINGSNALVLYSQGSARRLPIVAHLFRTQSRFLGYSGAHIPQRILSWPD